MYSDSVLLVCSCDCEAARGAPRFRSVRFRSVMGDENEYAWEGDFSRTWEQIEESLDGSLRMNTGLRGSFSKDAAVHVGVRRGVIRSLYLVLDCSKHAAETDADMRPSRLVVMQQAAIAFVRNYFKQNPISKLAIIVTRDARAEALTPASCNPRQQVEALQALSECGGNASLQNALDYAKESFSLQPSFVSREVVLLSASLSTCDPGDIHSSIAALAAAKVRCSVFSLLAEVFVLRQLALNTGGEFGVALGPMHLEQLLAQLLPPPPLRKSASGAPPPAHLIKVGFPTRQSKMEEVLCFSANLSRAEGTLIERLGYGLRSLPAGGIECPQCGATHAQIPTECPICGLRLLAATDLTKVCDRQPNLALKHSHCHL